MYVSAQLSGDVIELTLAASKIYEFKQGRTVTSILIYSLKTLTSQLSLMVWHVTEAPSVMWVNLSSD